MADFTYGSLTLPSTKVDKRPIPSGQDVNYWAALDANSAFDALKSLRSASLAISPGSTAPGSPYTAPADVPLGTGKMIGLAADGSGAVGVVLDNFTSLVTSGAKLVSARNATVEKFYVDKDGKLGVGTQIISIGGTALTLQSSIAGGSVTAVIVDTSSFLTGTSKLFSVRNAAAEVLYVEVLGGLISAARTAGARAIVTYSASMTADAILGNTQVISPTNGTAFTINAPTNINPVTGQRMTFMIRNISGGALGAATWNAVFKMVAWVQPANGFSRSIDFIYDGTNWVEVSRTAADVAN